MASSFVPCQFCKNRCQGELQKKDNGLSLEWQVLNIRGQDVLRWREPTMLMSSREKCSAERQKLRVIMLGSWKRNSCVFWCSASCRHRHVILTWAQFHKTDEKGNQKKEVTWIFVQTTHDIFVDSHLLNSLLDHTSTARSHVFNIYMVYTSKWKNIFISLHPSTQVI